MPAAYIFWMLLILAFIFGGWCYWPRPGGPPPYGAWGGGAFLLILVLLLGLAVFGWPVK